MDCDIAELERLSIILASITSELGSQKYSSVLTAGGKQLLLTKDGNPVLQFGIEDSATDFSSGKEASLIEKFVENFENLKHIVILYDEPEIARRVEFQYLKSGLLNGERCVYVISDDDVESSDSIRKQMDSFGIDTTRYTRNDLLQFIKIDDPAKDPQGFVSGAQKILDLLPLHKSKPPRVRMVAHMKYQFNSKEEADGHSQVERLLDSTFGNFNDSLLCSHYIGKYDVETHGDWMRCMLQNHGVSFVVCSEKNMPFMLQKRNIPIASSSPAVTTAEEVQLVGGLESEIINLSAEELERDLSEIKNDILFLTSQVSADLESYDPGDLQEAITRISLLKRKEEIMESKGQN